MKQEFLEVNGLKFSVWTWGNPKSPPLFFIHGFADTGKNFQWVAENLKSDYFCIAPDLRGHGSSEKSKSPLGYFLIPSNKGSTRTFDYTRTCLFILNIVILSSVRPYLRSGFTGGV